MTAPRTAELTIRGRNGRQWATVQWPTVISHGTSSPLVFFSRSWFGGDDDDLAKTLGSAMCSAPDIVALRMHSRESHGYESAVGDATTVVEWIADHANELNADPSLLIIAGDGKAADVVVDVVRFARDEGWPAIAHHMLIDPSDTSALEQRLGRRRVGPSVTDKPLEQPTSNPVTRRTS